MTIDGVGATYNALGQMVEQNRSGSYTEIQYSPTGFKMLTMNGSSFGYAVVPMPGGTAEIWTGSANYYRHSDWLGSSRLASTYSRSVYFDGAYAPYGESYATNGTTDLSFTGMNQDTASNLYDFSAREYGIQGRWASPDPAGMAAVDPTDPRSWNRYAYVLNNPLALVDPTGEDWCDDMGWICTSFLGSNWGGSGGGSAASEGGPPIQVTANQWAGMSVTSCDPSTDPNQCGYQDPSNTATLVNPGGGCVYVLANPCAASSTVAPQSPGANNGMPPRPTKLQQTLDRAKTCAKSYYGFNTLPGATQDATRLALIPAAPIIPKAAAGLPQALGSGPLTNLLSYFSLGSGTAASGANIFRVAGRIGAPIAIASAVIDATAISICTLIDQ